ncbi:LysR family transcriptional regulator [Pelagibius sp. Alg239-R121]|uniref:LysR family transcriptional regulator n=1 Tax=Pelagibius sp. Alg239-R121 TaxID=2993448 RepID=UPI0024A6BDA4|nr:LysR family transcriptional regulator [Pelagibius sp. Alg239-R121]
MNLRQLHTLAAFYERGSFAAAGDHVGLSHSAVSVQMQQLEEELGTALFDRSSRPPVLTGTGAQIALLGREVLDQVEAIRRVASGQDVAGSLSIGFVPTTLYSLVPGVLNELRVHFPQLQVIVKSGLSSELAALVLGRELDFAILTSPVVAMPDLEITEIASELLYAIGPPSRAEVTGDAALVRSMPFISFSKKTWLGQQIAARLQSRGIYVDEIMEVDSLDAIEKLVLDGFGVSIVPQRLLAQPLSEKLVRIPFCQPAEQRKLVLVQHAQGRRSELEQAVREIAAGLPE